MLSTYDPSRYISDTSFMTQSVDTSDGLPQPVYSSMQSISDNIAAQETLSPTPTTNMEASSIVPTQDLSPYLLRLVFDPKGQDVQSEEFSNKLKSGLVAAFLEALRIKNSNRRRKRDVSDPDVEVVLYESPESSDGEASVMFYIKVNGVPMPADEVEELMSLLSAEDLNTVSKLQVLQPIERVKKDASTIGSGVKTPQPTQPSDTLSSSQRLQYSIYTDLSVSDLQSTPTVVNTNSEQQLDMIASMTQSGGFIAILPSSISDGISHEYTPSTTETAYFFISRSGSSLQSSQLSPSFGTDSIFTTIQTVLTTTSVGLDIFSLSTQSVTSIDIFPSSGSLAISSESGFTHPISGSADSSKITEFLQTSDVVSTSLLSSFVEAETKLTMLTIDSMTASLKSISTMVPFSSNVSAIEVLSMSTGSPSSLSLDESQHTSGIESSSGYLIMDSITESRSLLLGLTSSIILISESTESHQPPRTMIPSTPIATALTTPQVISDTGLITSRSTLVMDTTQVLTTSHLSSTETLLSTETLKTIAMTPIFLTTDGLLTNQVIPTESLQTSTLPNIPIQPSSQVRSNPTSLTTEELSTTQILLSTPPSSTLSMESTRTATILSTPMLPTSSIVPITSAPPTKAPTTPPTSAPTTPSADSLMVIKVSVKVDRNITDGVFQTEIENGLEVIYMEGAGISQRRRRRKRSLDDYEVDQPIVLYKRQVENEPKVTITSMDRDPTQQTDVSSEFYVIQNGQVVAPDKAVPVFNRLTDAQKSAILGYSAIGPVKAVGGEVTPASTTAPSDNTTLLFIVAIVLPCLLVLVLIIIIVKCYVVDRWNRGSILPYKRGESLGDHNLTIDIEKGEITPSRSLRGSEKGSQLSEYSLGRGKKIQIAVTSGTSNGNPNTEDSTLASSQRGDKGTNRDIKHDAEINSRRNTLKDFAEMRDNEATHRNTDLSNHLLGLNHQDGGPSSTEIPNPESQVTNHQQQKVLPKQISVHEDVIQKSTSQRRDRAPSSPNRSRQGDRRRSLERAQIFGMKESVIEATHVKKAEKTPKETAYATMTPSVSTHSDTLAKGKFPEKNRSRKHKSRSEVDHHPDPRDYYYLTLKKPDPTSTSDSGDHTDASDEFTILVPKSPQGRIVEGHTNQIFFNNRMHATPIGASKQVRSHRRGTLKGEEGLTPTSKSRIRSPIKKQRKTTMELKEFDPCYSPESASEVENDTPYNRYKHDDPANSYSHDYSSQNYSNDLSPNVDKPNIHPFDSPNRLRIPTSTIRKEQRRRAANREEARQSHLMQDFTVPYSRHARQVDDSEVNPELLPGHVSSYSADRNPDQELITRRSVEPSFNSNTFTKSDTSPPRPTNARDQQDGDNTVGHYISQGRDSDKGLDNPGYSNDIFLQPKMKSTAIGPDVSTTETNTQTSDHETAATDNDRNSNKEQGALPYVDPVKKDMITQTSRDFGAQAKLTQADSSSKSAAYHSNVSNSFDTISQPVPIESLTQSSLVTLPTTSIMPSRDEHEQQTRNSVPNPFTLHSIQTKQNNQQPAYQTPLIQNVQTQRPSDPPVAEMHNNQFLQGLHQPQNTQMAQLQQPLFGSPRPTQASYYQSYPNQPLFYQAPNQIPETNLSYHIPEQERPATASQIHLIPDYPSQSTLPGELGLYDNRPPRSATQMQPNYYNSHTSQYGNQYLAAPGYSSLPQTEIVPSNHQHDTMSGHPVTNEQIIVHSRMARYNPYEDIPPEPPAVRYHHIPEPNYLVQPEFPPLDSGIEQPDTLSNIPVFYQHPIKESPRHHVSSPRDQQQHTREYEEVIQSVQSDSWKDDSRKHRDRDANQLHRNDDDEDISRRSDDSQHNKNKKPGKEHVRFEDDSQTSPRRQPHDKKTHSASPKRSDKRRREKHPDDDTETTSSLSSPRRQDEKNDDRSHRHKHMSPREEEKYENEKKHKASPKQTSEKEKVTKVSRPKKRKEKEDEHHAQSGRRSPQSPDRTPSPSPRRQKRNEPEERDESSRSSSQTSSPRKSDHHDDDDNDYSEEESYRSSGSKKSTPRSYESDEQYSEDSFLSESENESENESSQLISHGSREKDKGKSRQSNGRKPRRDERTYSNSEDDSEISESRRNGRNNDGDDYYSEDSYSDRSTSRDKYQDDDRSKSRHGSRNERKKPQRPDDKRRRDSSHESTPRSPNQTVSQSDDDKIKNNNPRSKQKPEEEIILYENRKTKKPQDLYAEIKAQMLKSYKDLNRKTAKSMPDKVQNLTDDQLLLLYEFHRKRLLFQRRQEATVKARVLVNESFLAEEIQRLKKQQVDAKKKMKKLLNDAFPTTSSNDVEI
ncbi:uncharacterized protein LOC126825623 isoform X2 [Patella vulgata]|uniref:uncharacterized protein LOC126825623 isoform X2 n=1 Tax=Patella vulgata TaxID=6465 RepID=UPI0024A8F28E|nr:uncharacterized protein LOC126825623 isoform X2 [Patella vulgata]